jgi:hypothetical protein
MHNILLPFVAVLCLFAASAQAQVVLCESLGGQYRECRVGAAGKIRLVMEMSSGICAEGASWGTRSEGIVWVERGCRATFAIDAPGGARKTNLLVCESQNERRETCRANTRGGVEIARQLSKAACVEGVSWGATADTLWVDEGCRAEFVLGAAHQAPPNNQTLEQLVVCESHEGKKKQCAADTSAGVQLVRQLSASACNFGKEWGWDRGGVWVNKGCRAEFAVRGGPKPIAQTLTCESTNNTRHHCKADTKYGVALLRRVSENLCQLDRTWGFDDDGIWVNEGCRAQFILGGFRLPAAPASADRIMCESSDGARKLCAVDTSRGVGLLRQLGDKNCILNRTWGYDLDGIWVTEGCRAEFAVAR